MNGRITVQSQQVVAAYFSSKHLLPVGFVDHLYILQKEDGGEEKDDVPPMNRHFRGQFSNTKYFFLYGVMLV